MREIKFTIDEIERYFFSDELDDIDLSVPEVEEIK